MKNVFFYDLLYNLSISQEYAGFQVRNIGPFCKTRNKLQGLFNQVFVSNILLYIYILFSINQIKSFFIIIAGKFCRLNMNFD